MAHVDYFLKLDGVDGESQDSKHKGEIEILSFAWGATQSGTSGYGGGSGAGRVALNDVNVSKRTDKASPKLLLLCANGEHIKSAVLTARKAGKEQQEYYKVTFSDIIISSYQVGGAAGGDGSIPTEQISLNYSKLEIEYREQKPDGTLGGAVKSHWDQKKNVGG